MKRNFLIKIIYNFFFTIFTNEFYLFYTSFSIHPSNSRDLIVNSPLENYLQELTSIRPWWQLLPDKFEYSQYLFAEQCVDIIREKSIVITSGNWKIKFMCEKYFHSLNSPACVFDKPRVCQSIITDFTTEAIRMPVSLHSLNNTPDHKFTYKGNLNVRVFSNWVLKNFTPSPLQCES